MPLLEQSSLHIFQTIEEELKNDRVWFSLALSIDKINLTIAGVIQRKTLPGKTFSANEVIM